MSLSVTLPYMGQRGQGGSSLGSTCGAREFGGVDSPAGKVLPLHCKSWLGFQTGFRGNM